MHQCATFGELCVIFHPDRHIGRRTYLPKCKFWQVLMAVACLLTMPSKTARCNPTPLRYVCPTTNLGRIRSLYKLIPSLDPSPSPTKSMMSCMISESYCTYEGLRPNRVRCIPRHIGLVLSAHELLNPSAHFNCSKPKQTFDISIMQVLSGYRPSKWLS